jgi:FG-GAP repeat
MTPRGPFLIALQSTSMLLLAGALGACTQLIEADDATYVSLLHMSDAQNDDNFGTEVVLEAEELIAVAPNATLFSAEDTCGKIIDAPGAGRVVVFDHGDNGWKQTDELHRIGVRPGEGTVHFIAFRELPRISMARAGDTVAIGVPAAGFSACVGETVEQAGKVYLFRRSNDRWEVEAILRASPTLPDAFFGAAVALGDGELFVGSNAADGVGDPTSGDSSPRNNGVVYVFARESGSWRETQRILPSNPIDEGHFGCSLSVDSDTLAVGAWWDSHPERGIHSPHDILEAAGGGGELVDRSGAAYVFRKRGGRWEEETYFKAFNRDAFALFGESVALEGNFLFVGAPGESGSHATADAQEIASGAIEAETDTVTASGAVYVYQRGDQGWMHEAYLKALEPSAESLFGLSVAAHSGRVLIGAPWESPADAEGGTPAKRAGAAYLYERDGRGFAPVETFHPAMPSKGLNFGYSAALSDRYAVVGSGEDDVGPGSVSVFDLGP